MAFFFHLFQDFPLLAHLLLQPLFLEDGGMQFGLRAGDHAATLVLLFLAAFVVLTHHLDEGVDVALCLALLDESELVLCGPLQEGLGTLNLLLVVLDLLFLVADFKEEVLFAEFVGFQGMV